MDDDVGDVNVLFRVCVGEEDDDEFGVDSIGWTLNVALNGCAGDLTWTLGSRVGSRVVCERG